MNSTKVPTPRRLLVYNARKIESARANEMITYNGKYTEELGKDED